MLAFLLLPACAGPDDTVAGIDSAGDAARETGGDTGLTGPCPDGMVQVRDFCIDAFEATVTGDLGDLDAAGTWPESDSTAIASSVQGVLPTVPLSWYQASAACRNAGRHLCTVTEWQAACGETVLPWGDAPAPDAVCAVPAPDGTTAWTELQPTGSLPDCRSPEGVYDQIGNAWEWADPETTGDSGAPNAAKMGGAWYAGPGSATCAAGPFLDHPPEFSGTIAARCCVAAR